MIRIGVQLHPQHATYAELEQAAIACDQAGVDTLWTWDHFYPLFGQEGTPADGMRPRTTSPNAGDHFEAWTLLTAFACRTSKVEIGHLVGCNSYRNPQLVADMARTLDHISGGRAILGLGAGWFQRDYDEYGFEFGTGPSRLKDLERNLPLVEERLAKLTPQPLHKIPLMIGGGGEKVTLRIVAQHADMWNFPGDPDGFRAKNEILHEWCDKVGRPRTAVERTVLTMDVDKLDDYVAAGAQHIILGSSWPFSMEPVQQLVEWRAART